MTTPNRLRLVKGEKAKTDSNGATQLFHTDQLTALDLMKDLEGIIPAKLVTQFAPFIYKLKGGHIIQKQDEQKSDNPVVYIHPLRGELECGRFVDDTETMFDQYAPIVPKPTKPTELGHITLSPEIEHMHFAIKVSDDTHFAWVFVLRKNEFLKLLDSKPDNIQHYLQSAESLYKMIGVMLAKKSPHRFDVFILREIYEIFYREVLNVTAQKNSEAIAFFMGELLGMFTRYRAFKAGGKQETWHQLDVFQRFIDRMLSKYK